LKTGPTVMYRLHGRTISTFLNRMTVLCDGNPVDITANDGIDILEGRGLMLGGIERPFDNVVCLSICIEIDTIHCEAMRKDLLVCHTGRMSVPSPGAYWVAKE